MRTMNRLLLLALSIVFCQIARADISDLGIFVEPSLTYERGTAAVDFPAPLSSSSGNVDGFGLGAKVGFHLSEVFFLALDGRYSMPRYKDSSVSYEASSVALNWGPVAGIQMPNFGLRLWTTLIFAGSLNPESSGSFDVAFRKGTGYRVGAGLRVQMLSLNLEYQQIKYGETILEGFGPFSPGSTLDNISLENRSLIVSVSFPLEI